MRAQLLAFVILLVAGSAAAEIGSVGRDVRACLPLAGGRFALGGDGGLSLLDRAGRRIGPARTALSGLPDTRVHALAAAANGGLWIGTEAGVARLPSDAARPRSWRTASVRALLPRGSELFLGTWGEGVKRISADGAIAAIPFLEAAPSTEVETARRRVSSLAFWRGALVVGTGAGLFRLEGATLRLLPAALPSEQVWALHAAEDGGLLVGTLLGLGALAATPPRLSAPSADLRAIARDGASLLLGSFGDGLFAGAASSRRLAPAAPLEARHLTALAVAPGGAACLGAREGLWLRTGAGPWRRVELGGLPSGDLAALALDGDRIWLGTFDQGLHLLELGSATLRAIPGLDPQVNVIAVEASPAARRVWVGTARGLYEVEVARTGAVRVRRLGRSEGLPSDDIHSLATLSGGGLLVGTGRGAALLREGKTVAVVGRKRGLVISAVWALTEGADGAIWLGTSKGVFRGRFGGGWKRFSVASGHLGDDMVTALAARGSSVWVGSYSGGVARLDLEAGAGGAITSSQLDTESWVNLGGLTLTESALLVSTMDGLRRCPLRAGACETLTDPLPGRDVTATAQAGSKLWVATRRGLGSLTLR